MCFAVPGSDTARAMIGNGRARCTNGVFSAGTAPGVQRTVRPFVLESSAQRGLASTPVQYAPRFSHSINSRRVPSLLLHEMATIKIGLVGLSALEKVAKALFIDTKLAGNITFPGAAALLVLLTAARVKLEATIAAALDGGKAATFAKNEAEAEVDELITQIAGYVVSVAGHDEALILSAGFDVRKPSSSIGDLFAPGNLRADLTSKTGEIRSDWDVVYGAHEYEVQRNDGDPVVEADWRPLGMTTQSKYLDKGLTSGSTHWYRVRARGTAGDSPWSDPTQAMAR